MTDSSSGGGGGPGGLSGLTGMSSGSLLGLGSLAIGGAGLGAILGMGESPLPPEFSQLTSTQVPQLESMGSTTFGEGQSFLNQGESALNMAQQGQLTPEQQAQLQVYRSGLQNTAAQTYYNEGRAPSSDTSFISTQADIDTKVNAMAQSQIQSTIALGLGETQTGSSLTGQSLGFESAADQALIAAGSAQMQNDNQYRQSLTSAFTTIGTLFGSVAKVAPL